MFLKNDVSEIVKAVQVHHHTRTCRKYGSSCRFSYPKFPSDYTFIAQPLLQSDFKDEADYKQTKNMYKQILNDLKVQLEIMLECEEDLDQITLCEILKNCDIKKDDYYKALSVSEKGPVVVLKRSLKELFVNDYNREWLRAWNGNMDLQVCLDFFAVTTYITDYYTKDESGCTKLLRDFAKQNASSNLKEKMKCLAQVYLTHREMGESEAIYRIIPSLHLTCSNIKCVFLATGFPSERSRFLRKITDNKNCADAITLTMHWGKYQITTVVH